MKVNLATIENAVILYINKELCPKLGDVRKWLLPVIAGSMIPSMEKLYLKHKETILSTGFVDSEDMFDIDKIYDSFHTVAEKMGAVEQNIPLLGIVRFDIKDIESLYRLIRESAGIDNSSKFSIS